MVTQAVLGLWLGGHGAVFGTIGAVLGIVNTILTWLPKPQDSTPNTKVFIAVALEHPHVRKGYGGAIDIRLYDQSNNLIGSPAVDYGIAEGNSQWTLTYKSDELHKGHQAIYGVFTGNRDGICIQSIGVQWSDTTQYLMTGDWAHDSLCDIPWSMGNGQFGHWQGKPAPRGEPYTPLCIWLDKHGRDHKATAVQLFFPALTTKKGNRSELPTKEEVCYTPNFLPSRVPDEGGLVPHKDWRHPYADLPKPVHGRSPDAPDTVYTYIHANGTETPAIIPRRVPPGPRTKLLSTDDRVIVSNQVAHRASWLCAGFNSWGPSLVSHSEGTFCDMKTKTMWPLCRSPRQVNEHCFNETTMSLESADVTGRVLEKRTKAFAFSHVLDWTMNYDDDDDDDGGVEEDEDEDEEDGEKEENGDEEHGSE